MLTPVLPLPLHPPNPLLLSCVKRTGTVVQARASRSSSASAMDPDEVLTFRHFIVCAWVFCTFEKSGLVSLAFMSYDEDRSGRLDWTAMEKMVCEVYVSSCYSA